MKIIYKLLGIALVHFPLLSVAVPNVTYHSFLMNGFNHVDAVNCTNLINACPSEHHIRDEFCVKNVLNNHPFCKQLQKLSQVLNASASQLSVKQERVFSLVDVSYPADAHHRYYIITPRGYLVDTVIDPRKLNKLLQQKYKSANFLISNEEVPYYESNLDGSHQFSAILKINDTCMACKELGRAKVDFNFDRQGKLSSIILVGYDDSSETQ